MFDRSLPRSLFPSLPNRESITLRVKTGVGEVGSADTYADPQTPTARRRPATDDEIVWAKVGGEEEAIVFSVLDDGLIAGFRPPSVDSKITDAAGVNWRVKKVKAAVLETLYSCVCVKMWG